MGVWLFLVIPYWLLEEGAGIKGSYLKSNRAQDCNFQVRTSRHLALWCKPSAVDTPWLPPTRSREPEGIPKGQQPQPATQPTS